MSHLRRSIDRHRQADHHTTVKIPVCTVSAHSDFINLQPIDNPLRAPNSFLGKSFDRIKFPWHGKWIHNRREMPINVLSWIWWWIAVQTSLGFSHSTESSMCPPRTVCLIWLRDFLLVSVVQPYDNVHLAYPRLPHSAVRSPIRTTY